MSGRTPISHSLVLPVVFGPTFRPQRVAGFGGAAHDVDPRSGRRGRASRSINSSSDRTRRFAPIDRHRRPGGAIARRLPTSTIPKKSSSRQSVELFSLTNPPPSPSPRSVKYEEVEQDVPSLPKLRKCASNVYSCEIIKKMELAGASPVPAPPLETPNQKPFQKNLSPRESRPLTSQPNPLSNTVLIELEWDLAMVVSAHFLEAVFAVTDGGTFPYDDVGDRHWTPACAAQLQKLCCYLHSICLQDAHLAASAGSASQLAAAIIATGRLQLNIYPVWPNELAVATGYQCDELGPIMSKILALYKDALPVQHAHPPAGGVGYEGYPGGDVDTVITAMPGSIQVGGPGCDDELVCDGGKDGREFLTPSPTGPLDSHGFFDEPMESSLGTAVYC